jgi:hypothetical protein
MVKGRVFVYVYIIYETACPAKRHADMNTFAVVKPTRKRIHADECDSKTDRKFSKGYFCCIDCGNDVFVRRGDKRVWHFAHYHEEDAKKCPHANGGETREHYDAKHFIARNIGRCAFAVEKCTCCHEYSFFSSRHNGRPLRIQECTSEVEMRIPQTSRVADVAAINPATGSVIAAIEVFHTHETDADKRKECAMQGIQVLEVSTSEVQRFQPPSAPPKMGLMCMKTTDMLQTECSKCTVKNSRKRELQDVVDCERQYTDSCALFYSRAFAPKRSCSFALAAPVVWQSNAEYLDELEYDRWYTMMWISYGKRVDARIQHSMLRNERAVLQKQGFDLARAKLDKQKNRAGARSNGKRSYTRGSCITKCKACEKWVFNDNPDDVCEVESGTMPVVEWNALFAKDPMKFRKKYKLADGEPNMIYVHEQCSIECPACKDCCLLNQIAKFGACFSCNTYFTRQLSRLEKIM